MVQIIANFLSFLAADLLLVHQYLGLILGLEVLVRISNIFIHYIIANILCDRYYHEVLKFHQLVLVHGRLLLLFFLLGVRLGLRIRRTGLNVLCPLTIFANGAAALFFRVGWLLFLRGRVRSVGFLMINFRQLLCFYKVDLK